MTTKTFIAELTYCSGPDGFRGAYVVEGRAIIDGGETHIKLSDPRPITEKDFTELLGGEVPKIIEAADQARASAVEAARLLKAERHAHSTELQAHKNRADTAEKKLKLASDRIAARIAVATGVTVRPAKTSPTEP